MNKTFSILIPTIDRDKKPLALLIKQFGEQVQKYSLQERFSFFIMPDSNQTGVDNSIGSKRNKLLHLCDTDYMAFVDSDDRISNDYLLQVFRGISIEPDCCSLNGIITFDGAGAKKFTHSIRYNRYYEEDNVYYRFPNHLNCIKTSIAKQFKFPCVNFSEDYDWAVKVHKSELLKKEYQIESNLYFYDYIKNK